MKITRRQFITSAAATGLVLHVAPLGATEKTGEAEATAWDAIREFYFQDRPINESNPVSRITAPLRAQNGADVSVQIAALAPQTEQKYIKKHYLVVDNNPSPLVGEFTLHLQNGSADIATRIRIDQYSHVRVISETQDGRLYMNKTFVKSSGGCSAPPVSDTAMAALTLGKTRLIEERLDDGLRKIYVSVMHPNTSGLQRDIVTNMTIPPHYVTSVEIFNAASEAVFLVSSDISLSENPSFEFHYKSQSDDALIARIKDSQGKIYNSARLSLAAL